MNKFQILKEIENSVGVFYPAGIDEYRIRCPFCGDSQKNLKSAHMYLKCSRDESEPIVFHCFKCNKGGKLSNDFLKLLNIKETIKEVNIVNNKFYNFKTHKIDLSNVIVPSSINYIKYRLGDGLSKEDYLNFRIISLENLKEVFKNKRIVHTLPTDSDVISFITEDNSTLIMRSLFDNNYRWRKIELFNDGVPVYTIKTQIDLFTKGSINVHVTEGIFDAISAYKNFKSKNSVFIAVLGSDYKKGINYCIDKGIIGSNVNINFYLDQDINENKIKKELKNLKWIFGEMKYFKNAVEHDIGVPYEKIKLIEV